MGEITPSFGQNTLVLTRLKTNMKERYDGGGGEQSRNLEIYSYMVN